MSLKKDCYWYSEWQDMNAYIPECKARDVPYLESKDCENCKHYHNKYMYTNADHIRAMTDEELADFFEDWFACNISRQGCRANWKYCGLDCKKAWLVWLKEEVKDEQ